MFDKNQYKTLSVFDRLILFGASKHDMSSLNRNILLLRRFAILEFQSYLEKKTLTHEKLLYKFTKCILSAQCNNLKSTNEIGTIFQKAYDIFIDQLIIGKYKFQHVAYKDIAPDNNAFINIEYKKLKLLHNALLDGKEDLYENINNSIKFIDDYYIKKTLFKDSYILKEVTKKYSNNNLDMKKKMHKKNIELSIKNTIFAEKIKLLNHSFTIVEKDLNYFLSSQYQYFQESIINQFKRDKDEIYNYLSLNKYNSKKAATYKNIFDFLVNTNCNHLTKERGSTYYIFFYDILMLKYKLITIFRALKVHKLNKEDLKTLIDNDSLENIQERKKYFSFFENITKENQINAYIYKMLSNDNETNAIRHILNYKKEDKPLLEHINIFYFLPNTLEKSTPFIAFNSFINPINS